MSGIAAPAAPAFGVPGLDLPGAPEPGRLRLVLAPPAWLDGLVARLLLEAVASGRDGVLVCGDNRLDAYGLLAQARARGLESEMADGVWLARAFTVHQLVALLEETLPAMARGRPVGVALATGLLEMFLDEDVALQESRVLLRRSLRRLDAWAAQSAFPVVATLSPAPGPRAEALLAEVRACGAQRVEMAAPASGRTPASVLKQARLPEAA